MGLAQFLPLLALTARCYGAALPEAENLDLDFVLDTFQNFVANPDPYMEAIGVRAKRSTENHAGFKEFPIPFLGAEVGIKYKDPNNRRKGGEAFLHIDDLQSLVEQAHSKEVKVHVKFDGGDMTTDGLFTAEVDYHLEHKDGDGVEEGSLKIAREMKAGKWHTLVTSETKPFSGVPIIPAKISNMKLDIESDWKTSLKAKYFNGPAARDLKVDIVRVPGQKITATITNHGVESTVVGTLTKPSSNEIKIDVVATRGPTKFTAEISGKMEAGQSTKLKIDLKKGTEGILQSQVEVKMSGRMGKFRGRYSIMGGKVSQGNFVGKFDLNQGVYELEAKPFKLVVALKLGESIKVTASKDGVEMWTYETLRKTTDDANAFDMSAKSSMTLNPNSQLYKLIESNYVFGAFKTRENNFKLHIDKNNRNFLFRKFKLEFDVKKDAETVLELVADTTTPVYNFKLSAPNLFAMIPGFAHQEITVTVDHVRGSHLNIESNILGGLVLNAEQKPNTLGGRTINVRATKANVEMFKYDADTSKVNNAAMLKVGLKGNFVLNSESVLYKTIVSNYKILTPFNTRSSDLEFFWDKQNKNAVMNKWYAKAKVDKDSTNVLDVHISTNEKPYKFYVYFPALLEKLRDGMQVVDVTVDHNPGQSLEMKVNHAGAKFKGFKIAKTGNGSEREIWWNGKKLGKGDFTLTDSMFTTTQTLDNGKSLTTTITWVNKWDTPAFVKSNKINVKLDGTERKLDMELNWAMDKVPDLDFNTPEKGHIDMNAVGQNARWGDYTFSRDFTWSSANQKMEVSLTGDSSFSAGRLAATSPVHTEIKFTYDKSSTDLAGKFMKVVAGKEYSITFPRGSFVMPMIKMGA